MTSHSDSLPEETKTVHLAKHVSPDGSVSALCFRRPRAIDLSKATWTNRREAVTCKKCRAKFKQATRNE